MYCVVKRGAEIRAGDLVVSILCRDRIPVCFDTPKDCDGFMYANPAVDYSLVECMSLGMLPGICLEPTPPERQNLEFASFNLKVPVLGWGMEEEPRQE